MHGVAETGSPRIRLVRHPNTLMRCLLLLLVHLLPPLLLVVLHLPLLLGCACMMMAHWCMMHVPIRGRTRPAIYGGSVQVHFPGGNQELVPGGTGKVRSHLPSTRRFLVSNSCHLGTDWTSGNQWAGRRCVKPHGRGFGCQRVTTGLLCYLPILTTFGWNGGSRVHTRPPGLRQGTTVFVHTSMDVEQQSDHKLMTPSGVGLLLVCGAGSRPSCHPGVVGGNCQRV